MSLPPRNSAFWVVSVVFLLIVAVLVWERYTYNAAAKNQVCKSLHAGQALAEVEDFLSGHDYDLTSGRNEDSFLVRGENYGTVCCAWFEQDTLVRREACISESECSSDCLSPES